MKFSADVTVLKNAVARVASFIEYKSELDALRRLRVDLVAHGIQLAGVSHAVTACDFLPFNQESLINDSVESGAVVSLPCKKLLEILGSFSDGAMSIKIDDTTITLSQGRSRFRLPRADEDKVMPLQVSWPEDTCAWSPVDLNELALALKRSSFQTRGNTGADTRPYTRTIHINDRHFVCTDGGFMSVLPNKLIHPLEDGFNLPLDMASKIYRAISSDDANGFFAVIDARLYLLVPPSFRLEVVPLAAGYPRYDHILEESRYESFKVDRDPFIRALNQVGLMGERGKGLRAATLVFDNGIHITSKGDYVGEASAVVECSCPLKTKPTHFDIDLLLPGLSRLSSGEFDLCIHEMTRPAIIRQGDFSYYVNPLRF